jgi:hypothetical protein
MEKGSCPSRWLSGRKQIRFLAHSNTRSFQQDSKSKAVSGLKGKAG